LIEAQLSGVPVVATPAGGISEAMVPGLTGIITAPDPSVDDIAAQVLSLADDPDRLRQMSKAGIQWASGAFSMEQMLRRSLAVIDGDRRLANQPDVTVAADS
jgi:glycosyltransferase involved in cell wall biosynthesis